MLKLINRLIDNSFFRFICVGLINTIIGYGSMLVLFNIFKMGYWSSTFIANSCGAILSYILNSSFTFKSTIGRSKSIPRFIIVILCCYLISYSMSGVITRFLLFLSSDSFSKQFCGNVSMFIGMCIYTLINYFGQKQFVFKNT
jgi:putative flippase GtrA